MFFWDNIYNLTIFDVVSQKACDQTCLLHAAVVILILTIWHWPNDPFQDGLRNKNSLKNYKLKGYINSKAILQRTITFIKVKVEKAAFIGYNIGGL